MFRRLTKTLLPQRQFLQVLKAVLLGSTVYDSVLEEIAIDAAVIDRAFDSGLLLAARGLKLPRVSSLILNQTRVVIALVEVFQDRTEDLGLLVRKRDLFDSIHVSGAKGVVEERAAAEDIFMSGEEALLGTDDQCHDSRGRAAVPTWVYRI